MKPYTLPLSDSQATLENVGGKGMSLAKMINAGLPIPNGFHITTETYRAFVEVNNLQAKILDSLNNVDVSIPASLDTASQTICGLFAGGEILPDIAESIMEAYKAFQHPSPSPK
jgi:pyruvate,water dikinase